MRNNHDLGVALTKCYFCHESDKIVMNTRLAPQIAARVEEMNGKVIDMDPCNKCKALMQQGVILITIDSEKSGTDWHKPPNEAWDDRRGVWAPDPNWMPNPYRTGGWFVVKDDAIRRMMPDSPDLAEWAIKHRWMFIEDEAARKIGLFAEGERMTKEAGTGKEETT